MPKQNSKNKTAASIKEQDKATLVENGPVSVDKTGNVCIKVLAKPGAKNNQITAVDEEGVGIQINAPPVDGEANKELIGYVAEILGIRKQDVSLSKGSKSKHKTLILLSKILSAKDVLKKLTEEAVKK